MPDVIDIVYRLESENRHLREQNAKLLEALKECAEALYLATLRECSETKGGVHP
jgi:hypothetical protein